MTLEAMSFENGHHVRFERRRNFRAGSLRPTCEKGRRRASNERKQDGESSLHHANYDRVERESPDNLCNGLILERDDLSSLWIQRMLQGERPFSFPNRFEKKAATSLRTPKLGLLRRKCISTKARCPFFEVA